jgi:hypothetical protein
MQKIQGHCKESGYAFVSLDDFSEKTWVRKDEISFSIVPNATKSKMTRQAADLDVGNAF